MLKYLAWALILASITVLPGFGHASAHTMVLVAMLDSHGQHDHVGASGFRTRKGRGVVPSPGVHYSPAAISGPSYFSAFRRYEHQHGQERQRLQGYGFGSGWNSKPR